MTTEVVFDRAMVLRLRAAYILAHKTEQDRFVFEGNEYVTAYAMYLLEYLIPKFID